MAFKILLSLDFRMLLCLDFTSYSAWISKNFFVSTLEPLFAWILASFFGFYHPSLDISSFLWILASFHPSLKSHSNSPIVVSKLTLFAVLAVASSLSIGQTVVTPLGPKRQATNERAPHDL